MRLATHRRCSSWPLGCCAFCVTGVAGLKADELQDANQLFRQGQFDRALERVNSYLASRPKDARGRFLKGLILTEQNKPNDAIKVFTDLIAGLSRAARAVQQSRGALCLAGPVRQGAHRARDGDPHASELRHRARKPGRHLRQDGEPGLRQGAAARQEQSATAQTKLNLIKDLFPTGRPTPRPSAKGEPPAKVATAPAVVKPAPSQPPASPPSSSRRNPKSRPPKPRRPRNPPRKPLRAANRQCQAHGAQGTGQTRRRAELGRRAQRGDRLGESLVGERRGRLSRALCGRLSDAQGREPQRWEAQRKTRIAKPRKIEVAVESPKVTFDEANRATVTFRQHYQSGSLKVSSTKTLVMVKDGDKWLIQQERAGS